MAKYKYFELSEFIFSTTAIVRNIDNTPTFEVVDHLEELIENILEPLRKAWGSPIKVTSGYRCPALNAAVGGTATSVHKIGYAADIVPVTGSFAKFRDFVVNWAKTNNIAFDQILLETDSHGSKWIHIGIRNNAGQQRRQIKVMNV